MHVYRHFSCWFAVVSNFYCQFGKLHTQAKQVPATRPRRALSCTMSAYAINEKIINWKALEVKAKKPNNLLSSACGSNLHFHLLTFQIYDRSQFQPTNFPVCRLPSVVCGPLLALMSAAGTVAVLATHLLGDSSRIFIAFIWLLAFDSLLLTKILLLIWRWFSFHKFVSAFV